MNGRFVLALAVLCAACLGLGLSDHWKEDAAIQDARAARLDAGRARAQAVEAFRARVVAEKSSREVHRALLASASALDAIRLAALGSSDDPAVQAAMFRTLYALASCESTGTVPAPPVALGNTLDASAVNPTGEHAVGLFQFLPSTWRSTPYRGFPILSPVAQAFAAAWMIRHGRAREWACTRVVQRAA